MILLRLLFLLSLLTISLLSCQLNPTFVDFGELIEAEKPAPDPNGQLVLGLVGDLNSLNPLTDLSKPLTIISPLLYASINTVNPANAQLSSGLANEVTILDDNLTARFTFGDAVTAVNAKVSLENAIWPRLENIRSVQIIDDVMLEIDLYTPDCALLDRLGQLPVLTADTVQARIPAGSGPFRLVEWDEPTGVLKLEPNPDTGQSQPQLAGLTIRLFDSVTVAWQALQANEIDLLTVKNQPQSLPVGYRAMAYSAPERFFLQLNNEDEILSVAAVRQALSLAINRQYLLEYGLNGQGQLMQSALPPQHWAATDLALPDYAPAEADHLLETAGLVDRDGDGWRDLANGETWHLPIRVQTDNVVASNISFILADAYRQVGIHARAELVPQFAILDDLTTRDYAAAVYGLTVLPELDERPYWHSDQIELDVGLNLAAYHNEMVDHLLDEANQTPGCKVEERIQYYQQIQQQLQLDQPVDFLLVPNHFLVVRDTVYGLEPTPFAPFTWNSVGWFVATPSREH